MSTIRIINGVDASGDPFECCVAGDRISSSADVLSSGERTVDAEGCVLLPGLIDMHVHFRDPWQEGTEKGAESIDSGSRAALNGGVTSCACMPNTHPPADSPEIIRYIVDKGKQAGTCSVYPIGALTKGRNGRELVPFEQMLKSGAVGFSDDGSTLMDPAVMKKALEASRVEGFPVITHSLDETGYEGWVFNQGSASLKYNVPGIPNASEYSIVERDIEIARDTGGRLHIAHVSAGETVAIIGKAKENGVNVTCEVTPHHLIFSEKDISPPEGMFKMSPPLRNEADRQALIEGVVSGIIDVIASDHAPHPLSKKGGDIREAAFGIIGIETMLFLIMTEFVSRGLFSCETALERMSRNPARILGIEGGKLEQGETADIIIFDPDREWECTEDFFTSQSINSPFIGRMMQGYIRRMFVKGKEV